MILDSAGKATVTSKLGVAKNFWEGAAMKSRFQISTCKSFVNRQPARLQVQADPGESTTHSHEVIYLNGRVTENDHNVLTRLWKRLGAIRFAQALFKSGPFLDVDPYLLVLLADQAFNAGREEQAIFLVDTAYEVYDRQRNTTRLRHISHTPRIVPRNTAISLSTG
jgi:hypothetical protein